MIRVYFNLVVSIFCMDVDRFTLSNGLRVVNLKLPIESVSMVVSVGVGYLDESSECLGVSHLLEHLLFDGTKSYPNEFSFCDAAEKLGGDINGTTEEYSTSFEFRVFKSDFEEAVKLLSELVFHPLFLKEKFEKEKKVILAEMLSRRDVFKKHPVKTVLYNYLDGFDQMERLEREIKNIPLLSEELVLNHFEKYYQPSNMVLWVVGEVENLKELLETHFNKEGSVFGRRVVPDFVSPKKNIERVSDTEEVRSIFFNWFGPGLFSEERAVFEVVAKIISKGENGVIKAIRFDKGLAYEVDAFLNSDERKGVFIVAAKTSKENMTKVEDIIKEKVFALRSVSDSEVESAKKSVLAESVLDMEDYLEDARVISNTELYSKKTPFEGYFDEIRRVDARVVRDFAKKYFGEDFVLITSK